ncbi:polysaccharide biosynthesis/export family protein [Arenibacterium halophilum]|nr:polysaccharide biosynthesis/export family protein [Arenibacterium halophilum]
MTGIVSLPGNMAEMRALITGWRQSGPPPRDCCPRGTSATHRAAEMRPESVISLEFEPQGLKIDQNRTLYVRESAMMTMSRVFAALLFALIGGSALAQDDYRIKPGDVVRIEVLEDSSLNRESLVLPDGRVTVPLAGTVSVGGRSVDQVRQDVTGKLAPNFASEPNVIVSLVQLGEPAPTVASGVSSRMPIYLMGEVNTPGMIEVKRGTTLLQALAQAGGFNRFAAVKRVQLRRVGNDGVQKVYQFNYNDVLNGKNSIGATKLAKGDVIVVPARKLFE